MTPTAPTVISASRRTDIPAFYMPWFMDHIRRGRFEVVNPFNRRTRVVTATSESVHSIVFWSKDYGAFIRNRYADLLSARGYRLYFNFSLNSTDRLLEPHVPPLSQRLQQMEALCRQNGPQCVQWRFDPICNYRWGDAPIQDNLADFERIAAAAANAGIRRCITSFMDLYAKIHRRLAARPGLAFKEPSLDRQRRIVQRMAARLTPLGIELRLCCEKELLQTLPASSTITAGACVPNDELMALFGGRPSLRKDPGQRTRQGCGCMVSVDVGSYDRQPCYHNCLFCYANPRDPGRSAGRAPAGRLEPDMQTPQSGRGP